MYTLAQVSEAVRDVVGGGSCRDAPTVTRRVNEAVRRLITMGDWKGTLYRLRMYTQQGCVVMPPEVEAIRAAKVTGHNTEVRSRWYEFLDAGPTLLAASADCNPRLYDKGWTPVFRQPPGCMHILALSDREEEEGVEITISGKDCCGDPLRNVVACTSTDAPDMGESLELGGEEGSEYTASRVSWITGISKPVTRGVVRLYPYDPKLHRHFGMIGTYFPTDTSPVYHRYQVPGIPEGKEAVLDVIVKVRFLPAHYPSDPIPVSPDAVKMMIMAIESFQGRDIKRAEQYQFDAMRLLNSELRNATLGTTSVVHLRKPSFIPGFGIRGVK